ncbi:MAG: ATP-dependent helicase [Chloroflexota bacterium]
MIPPILSPLFRPEQNDIMSYRSGKLGVAAVPGSGKTFTLSNLAARLVERLVENGTAEEQEVLIVTFANSAVNSFKARIGNIVTTQRGLLPYIGYRVRTLHGLAHDIVRERPSLVGLAEDFLIMDDRAAAAMLRETVDSLLKTSGDMFNQYLDDDFRADEKNVRRIQMHDLPELAVGIADAFIRQAKDQLLDPTELRQRLEDSGEDLPLARFGVEVYETYQRGLAYRGAVDFDDLVRLALMALQTDEAYRKRLQKRWPYILEDEAQDSSELQERMLRLLSGGKNWVRVGDPNQAINTTFTTANPRFLRDFLLEEGVKSYSLTEAGRSAVPILDLANALVRWTASEHPVEDLRTLAFYPQEIVPTSPGDLHPNPPDSEALIHIHYQPGATISPEKELELVATSLERWLADHPDLTAAVLVPANDRGFKLAEKLRERNVPYDELLRSTTATRAAAQKLYTVLVYLATPIDSAALAALYRDIWWPPHLGNLEDTDRTPPLDELLNKAVSALSRLRNVEAFLWPSPGDLPLDALKLNVDAPDLFDDLESFRQLVVRWLQAAILPIDQLILTVSQEMFANPPDIALSYKIAQLLRAASFNNPHWRLPQFADELRAISQNERKFLGFDDVEQGYEAQPGRVTIATMHAAKGLEWDRVYLMAVSNYSFPSVQPFDKYISERYFVRDDLNLQAETLAQLRALTSETRYVEGQETQQSRIDYAAERLRLLYVGITRAKRELVITWNLGRFAAQNAQAANQPALPLVALWEYLSEP